MSNMMRFFLYCTLIFSFSCKDTSVISKTPPNILFVITDDQSWLDVGSYGNQAVRTPHMNALAINGVQFSNAYTAAPSCSPSRAGILTGQDIYRLEEGGVLTGFIRDKFTVFPTLLEANGYTIGATGKRYWPKTKNAPGAQDMPLGKQEFRDKRFDTVPPGISRIDYTANFEYFLNLRDTSKPFFFWVGTSEPHLKHPEGYGLKSGIDTSKIILPSFYPNVPLVKTAIADYLFEIEWADKELGRILNLLKEKGLDENTLIIFTSDNGMPFPRAKATLYDYGVRMPLIAYWKNKIKGNRVVEDPVSLIDLAPTFLELASIEIPGEMTGRSIKNLLLSDKSGKLDPNREFVVTAIEKHTHARPDSLGFPRRAIHSVDWTYIVNYEPDRWPIGDSATYIQGWDYYGDIDPSAIKKYFVAHKDDPSFRKTFDQSFGKVPREELYHKETDPDMVNNLAYDPGHELTKEALEAKLNDYLERTEDPRTEGKAPWDFYYLDD